MTFPRIQAHGYCHPIAPQFISLLPPCLTHDRVEHSRVPVLDDGSIICKMRAVDETYHGVCQLCGRRIDFPADLTGLTRPCPHCGRDTRLKPAPVDLLESAPDAIPPHPTAIGDSHAKSAHKTDATEIRLKRSILRLIVVTIILIGVLIGLVAVANWLTKLLHP